MSQYQGIKKQALELLAENRLHDNKAFYEVHKEVLKQSVTIPLRQIMLELSDTLLDMDGEMYVDPVYSVSRIRRDTRYTKDKTLYRDHLWIMFRRNKHIYRNCPALWFEVCRDGYNYGIAFFTDRPADMNVFRDAVHAEPEQFFKALAAVKQARLNFLGDFYKKQRVSDVPEALLPYFNTKSLEFIRYRADIDRLADDRILRELKKMIQTVRPMYDFLLDVHEKIQIKENEYAG